MEDISNRDASPLELLAIASGPLGREYLSGTVSKKLPRGVKVWLDAQLDLRRRAAGKLESPHLWWLTDRGYQQSSGTRIAKYKASKLAALDRSPLPCWIDFCSGIGGDLLELARVQKVISVERDEYLRALQSLTLADHGLSDQVELMSFDLGEENGDESGSSHESLFESTWWPSITAWHLDPDRRVDERRSSQPEFHSPPETWIDRLIATKRLGCLKLAPAAKVERWEAMAQREWIGDAGECKQQLLWFCDKERARASRVVTLLDGPKGTRSLDLLEDSAFEPSRSEVEEGDLVFEPHAAVLAAKGSSTLIERHELEPLTIDGGYLRLVPSSSSDEAVAPIVQELSNWGAIFRVRQTEKLDRKRLSQWLRAHDIGIVEWKKRAIPAEWLTPIQKSLKLSGSQKVTAIVYPGEDRVIVALADRLTI